jgi:glycosyltransferase involved in cell wall biosynthesis
MPDIKTVLCASIDPWSEPTGGQTTFNQHLIQVFGPRLAVASTCSEALPEGRWLSRPFNGHEIQFFSFGRLQLPEGRKPFIPARLRVYWRAKRHMSRFYASGVRNILLESPEMLFAASSFKWDSVCYSLDGVNNAITNSRYRMARFLGPLFEDRTVAALHRIRPEVLIAAADGDAISEMHERTDGRLNQFPIYSFPTRVDTRKFYPENKTESRDRVGLPQNATVLLCVGRLCWIKGWELLLDVVSLLSRSVPNITMVFVGDGEDRGQIEAKASLLGIRHSILITGFLPHDQVRAYINAADVCLVASHLEGWSVAMLEVVACGRPMVSTSVSGAASLIRQGRNGWVLPTRDPVCYAEAIVNALHLPSVADVSLPIADKFAVTNLARDLGALWRPLAPVS